MMLRDHPGVQGKRDAYPFDPRMLKIDPSYNVRDLSTPEAKDKLAELKESIRANGVKVPLEVRFDGTDVYVVSGHRRHAAVMELIAEGEPIETVLTIHEAKGTNDAERVLNLVTSNSGEPLKPLEVAEVVRRLVAFGWDNTQIAKRLGWKSASSVNQYLDMLALPEGVKEHVRRDEISASLARKIAKGADPQQAEELIKANLEENRRITGGKRTKVTPKTIKRDAKPKPRSDQGSTATELPAEQQPATRVELPPASVPQSFNASTKPTLAVMAVNGSTPVEVTVTEPAFATIPQAQGVKALIEALEPFAAFAEFNDLNARSDDDVIEVKVADIKHAWRAYTTATGGAAS
jgi:ParB/RepB/Spo0J family partition protein